MYLARYAAGLFPPPVLIPNVLFLFFRSFFFLVALSIDEYVSLTAFFADIALSSRRLGSRH